jgi:hypothetical protein
MSAGRPAVAYREGRVPAQWRISISAPGAACWGGQAGNVRACGRSGPSGSGSSRVIANCEIFSATDRRVLVAEIVCFRYDGKEVFSSRIAVAILPSETPRVHRVTLFGERPRSCIGAFNAAGMARRAALRSVRESPVKEHQVPSIPPCDAGPVP